MDGPRTNGIGWGRTSRPGEIGCASSAAGTDALRADSLCEAASAAAIIDTCRMVDDSFWTCNPAPRCRPRQGELLWSVRKDGVTWSAELRYHGEYGVEAQILRNGELSIGRRFPLKMQAVRWAEGERAHVGERLEEWSE